MFSNEVNRVIDAYNRAESLTMEKRFPEAVDAIVSICGPWEAYRKVHKYAQIQGLEIRPAWYYRLTRFNAGYWWYDAFSNHAGQADSFFYRMNRRAGSIRLVNYMPEKRGYK